MYKKAFTLIEVLVVMAIVATILALTIPMCFKKDSDKALSFNEGQIVESVLDGRRGIIEQIDWYGEYDYAVKFPRSTKKRGDSLYVTEYCKEAELRAAE
jgi:prepilin-type N-terminal cleavage/methylation domain-containing protein